MGYIPLKTIGLIGLYPGNGILHSNSFVVSVSPTLIFVTFFTLIIIYPTSPKDNLLFTINYQELDELNKDYGYNLKQNGVKYNHLDGILGYNYIEKKKRFNLRKSSIHALSQKIISEEECELNHLQISPDNKSILFIYRNKKPSSYSELFMYNYKEDRLECLFSGKIVSHYNWIDSNRIIIFFAKKISTQGYYIFNIYTKEIMALDKKINHNGDGHPSISPNKEWIVYDSYPDKKRVSYLKLYNLKNNEIIKIGEFFSPMKFYGYYRCDLHPRWSPDGKFISIDSTHEGTRRTYMIDVSKIIYKII